MISMDKKGAQFTSYDVCCQLVCSKRSGPQYNWLFVPGGPGYDSCYFRSLIRLLDLSGNCWLIDFPNNGANDCSHKDKRDLGYWYDLFLPTISEFDNAIYVGHSFGSMFALLYPQLEEKLKGLVLIGTAQKLWYEEAAKKAQALNLPDITGLLNAYGQNQTQATFDAVNFVLVDYYAMPKSKAAMKQLLRETPCNIYGPLWWMNEVNKNSYETKWIPQQLPTLILSGRQDALTPYELIDKDSRFKRENILLHFIDEASHFVWIDQPQETIQAFEAFKAVL